MSETAVNHASEAPVAPQPDPYDPSLSIDEVVKELTDEIGRLTGELKMTQMRMVKIQNSARQREAELSRALQELAAQLPQEQPFQEPGGATDEAEEVDAEEVSPEALVSHDEARPGTGG